MGIQSYLRLVERMMSCGVVTKSPFSAIVPFVSLPSTNDGEPEYFNELRKRLRRLHFEIARMLILGH